MRVIIRLVCIRIHVIYVLLLRSRTVRIAKARNAIALRVCAGFILVVHDLWRVYSIMARFFIFDSIKEADAVVREKRLELFTHNEIDKAS